MTKITCDLNCGNSPKMEFIKEFNIAFAKGNETFLLDSVTDDIIWSIIGEKDINGKDKFANELREMKGIQASELKLDSILSHGKYGAANGLMIMPNGEKYAFSDVYLFSNTKGSKIKTITSYVIKID